MGAAIMPALAIGQATMGVVGAVAQSSHAASQEASQKEAAVKQTQAAYAEVSRQQVEVSRVAQEQKSDRIRAANAELGAARVAAMERGVSGTTMSAIVRNIGYLEGADLSRIEGSRVANIEAGEAAKVNAKNGMIESVNIAANQRSVATTGAWLGAAGSGLSIAGNYFQSQQSLNSLQNNRVV